MFIAAYDRVIFFVVFQTNKDEMRWE